MRKRLENHKGGEEVSEFLTEDHPEDRRLFTFCLTVRMQWKQKMIRNYFFLLRTVISSITLLPSQSQK